MATFYTDSNERVATPMLYLREHMPSSYQETQVLPGNMMLYMNSVSYSDTLGIDSASQQQQPQQQEILPNFNGSRIGEQDFNALRDFNPIGSSSSSILQNGLSLSLGTQIPGGGFQMSSAPFRNPNMGLVSFLSPNPSISEEGGGSRNGGSLRNESSRNGDYVSHSFPGSSLDLSTVARTIPNSRYLKAAQQLLDEVVNVRKALKQPEDVKDRSGNENQKRGKSTEDGAGGGVKNDDGDSSAKESSTSKELSHSERQELQNKLTKLLNMLDEVDKRYKQYHHQMQFVVSSFDSIAGPSAAKPYTALALQRISRHFRCLRDAINVQISGTRKDLGEQDSSSGNNGVGITRLRFVDQQLRQQRALQQLGMMQQHAAWRPQRGLPESSVSILRAWLFEHFLHPYPKDSDKIMLARQTGLTRSQVSNWFINARVRLWKPMVEEMYKEETGDLEMDSNSSSENAAKAMRGDAFRSSEERGEDNLQKTASTAATERGNGEKFSDPKSDQIPDIEMVGPSGGAANFQGGSREIEADYYVQSTLGNTRFVSEAANEYQMSELGRFGHGTRVSLTLGLRHFEGGTVPFSETMHHGFVPMRGDEFYGATGSSMGTEATEFEVISNPGNQHHRLGPGQQLLHDFVA
ncbi:BEL1-like homeodomain protein 6 [Punica granatum]|uniref:BEL1-like homeodomain protein 6 n=2 Tax=Punica granatum TaxID=22663 RepID=A0A6P8D161_PUNGR|nr:BEL1-like homeodomain protein 6 [Punica granatum]XP_031390121.1 BEL1-like homeodomain protein 6 [Punica granatum]PKI59474.1 hypothetical protein CRG98_020105 [Punica granatum]